MLSPEVGASDAAPVGGGGGGEIAAFDMSVEECKVGAEDMAVVHRGDRLGGVGVFSRALHVGDEHSLRGPFDPFVLERSVIPDAPYRGGSLLPHETVQSVMVAFLEGADVLVACLSRTGKDAPGFDGTALGGLRSHFLNVPDLNVHHSGGFRPDRIHIVQHQRGLPAHIVLGDALHAPAVVMFIHQGRLRQLLEIRYTADGLCLPPRGLQRRQKQRRQDGNDHYSIDIKLMSIGKYATYI